MAIPLCAQSAQLRRSASVLLPIAQPVSHPWLRGSWLTASRLSGRLCKFEHDCSGLAFQPIVSVQCWLYGPQWWCLHDLLCRCETQTSILLSLFVVLFKGQFKGVA